MIQVIENKSSPEVEGLVNSIVRAVTTVAIEYKKNGSVVVIASGTDIEVDVNNGIALIFGDHVTVSQDEYSFIHPCNEASVN